VTLGERCDEIVRLIDETLADIGVETASVPGIEMARLVRRPRASAEAPEVGSPRRTS
jgi:hypothetical protein